MKNIITTFAIKTLEALVITVVAVGLTTLAFCGVAQLALMLVSLCMDCTYMEEAWKVNRVGGASIGFFLAFCVVGCNSGPSQA